MKSTLYLLTLILVFGCGETSKKTKPKKVQIDTLQGLSLLGKTLVSRQVAPMDEKKITNYRKALADYNSDANQAEHIIWLGRRIAYLGDYQKAIEIYTEGIEKFHDDARFYRHRGHRYITTRQFDKAIDDLQKAVRLIQGTEDRVEPDGIPNRLNRPVSTLHTNIFYHLGLAHYLKADWTKALEHFQNCLDASKNDDMKVAASHWLYMILRRMEKPTEANALLEPITTEMEIIENDGYHQLLLFYKGLLEKNVLNGSGSAGSSEAVRYGFAHWHQYNGDFEEAVRLYGKLLDEGQWTAFGYIAAEAEMYHNEREDEN